MNHAIRQARILIIDDNEETVVQMEHMLRNSGYRFVQHVLDSRQALARIENWQPDLLILDLVMPPPDGFGIIDQLMLRRHAADNPAILVLTADLSQATRLRMLSLGAYGFLTEPIDRADSLLRIRNLIELRQLRQQVKHLTESRGAGHCCGEPEPDRETLERLVQISECLDAERSHRAEEVAALSAEIGVALGLEASAVTRLRSAARLYDFGMVAIPEAIRTSRTHLTVEERKIMKRHTVLAGEMFGGGNQPGIAMAREIAVAHHERWDGSGYPFGLKGAGIPLVARIVAVAQAYHALITERPYRPAAAAGQALEEISRQSGFAFDPAVVAGLLRALDRTPSAISAA